MVAKLDHDMVDVVYAIISQKGHIPKKDLEKSIEGMNVELLDDILFYLKVYKGVYTKRSRGVFKDYATYQKLK